MKEKKRGLLTGFLRKMLNKSRNDDETLASLAIASKESLNRETEICSKCSI